MTDAFQIDRRTLLSTTLGGLAAAMLGGCSDDAGPVVPLVPDAASATVDAGDAGMPGATTGGDASASGSATGSSSATPSSGDGGSPDAGTDAGSPDAGTSARPDAGGHTGGADAAGGDAGDAGGTGDAGSGGMADAGGTLCASVVETVNGHTHALSVPLSDVEAGYNDSGYLLEDGGTGHSHMLYVSAYDFLYLQAGSTVTLSSSEDAGHAHNCDVVCPVG